MLVRWQSRWLRWRRRLSRTEWAARHCGFALSQDPPHSPGLLLIQIDGLARRQLERAIKHGEMPFLRRLLRRKGYELHTFYSGQPASTPAVQGELYYGVRTAVPAFSFLDRQSGTIGLMMHPSFAKQVEARIAEGREGLLRGGSSWSNIYTGGAAPEESHFCAASIGFGDSWRSLRLKLLTLVLLLHLDVVFRVLGLLLLELAVGFGDAVRGVFLQGRRVGRELSFLIARVVACVGLRELVTLGASIDVARGLPVIHVNFVGYDEQAHRRGPDSRFAHWALHGIDDRIRRLYGAARRSDRRDYDIWVFSDHGQTACHQAEREVPDGLEGLVRKHWPPEAQTNAHPRVRSQVRTSPGHWLGGPRAGKREAQHTRAAELSAFEREQFAVAAMGSVGHIYFGHDIGVDAARRLAACLVRDGVPGVLWRDGEDEVVWLEAGGEHRLPRDAVLLDVDPPLREVLARDLAALCQHPHAGELVAIGWSPGKTPWSFAIENGAHAGPGRDEVLGFALIPPATWLPGGTEHFIRPEALRQAALRLLGRDRPVVVGASAIEPVRARGRRPVRTTPLPRVPHTAEETAEHGLRVVTYNVHGCLGTDGRVAPLRVARVLEQFDADLIAVQEIDSGRARSRGEDQLAVLADALGMHACFCPAVELNGERYGHGLLARVPMDVVRRQTFSPLPGMMLREPRAALWVTFAWHDRKLHAVGTHLGLGREERWGQVNELLRPEWLGDLNGADPIVLCGDLNLHPGSRGYRRLASRFRDVQAHAPAHVARRTFPAVFPVRCLDYVFVSRHFNVRAVHVPRDALTLVTSDHLPVVCDLDFV